MLKEFGFWYVGVLVITVVVVVVGVGCFLAWLGGFPGRCFVVRLHEQKIVFFKFSSCT